jgi:DNA-directed RNA polymerase specialized sigma24 family protein
MPAIPWRLTGAWRVPPNWSARYWRDEMRAQGYAAACQAEREYDPTRGVPYPTLVRRRILISLLARYRQERNFAARCRGRVESHHDEAAGTRRTAGPELRDALAALPDPDRRLIEQLFWGRYTESEVARRLGVSHQAVSKRKRAILDGLRSLLDLSE